MIKPLVSLIVPVYNVSRYLDACIKSLVEQSYSHIEIILIDDGSTDNSGQRCDKWADLDARIRVYHQINKGPAATRNEGVRLAEGEYILFVDSDDSLTENTVEKSVRLAVEQGSDIVCFDVSTDLDGALIDRSHLIAKPFPTILLSSGVDCLKYIYEGHIANYSWQFMYKKNLLHTSKVIFPENVHILEDAVFLNRVLPKANNVVYCAESLYNYHLRDNSLTRSKSFDKAEQGCLAIGEIERTSKRLGLYQKFCLHGIDLYIFIYNLAGDDCNPKTAKLIKFIRSNILRLAKYPVFTHLSFKRKIQISLIALHLYDFVVHMNFRFC